MLGHCHPFCLNSRRSLKHGVVPSILFGFGIAFHFPLWTTNIFPSLLRSVFFYSCRSHQHIFLSGTFFCNTSAHSLSVPSAVHAVARQSCAAWLLNYLWTTWIFNSVWPGLSFKAFLWFFGILITGFIIFFLKKGILI